MTRLRELDAKFEESGKMGRSMEVLDELTWELEGMEA